MTSAKQTCVAFLVIFLTAGAVTLLSQCAISSSAPDTQIHASSMQIGFAPTKPARLSILQLLESDYMKEAVENSSLRMAHVAQNWCVEFNMPCSGEQGFKLQGSFHRQNAFSRDEDYLRREASLGFQMSLLKFLKSNPHAARELHKVTVTWEQGMIALSMLRSLTDKRLFNMALNTAWAIYGFTNQSGSPATAIQRIRKQVKKQLPELRRLHEVLIPAKLKTLRNDVKRQHLRLLNKKGIFKLRGEIQGWNAEVSVFQKRQLQQNPSVLKQPLISTSQLILPTIFPGTMPPDHSRSDSVFPDSPVHTGSTPTNWFTIGAPVFSNMIGLTLLSLAVLLPPTGGMFTNRIANYAIWGVQGASVLAECLANAGFPQGVVYFAPCLIDILFFGLEVVWVFFDGLPDSIAQTNVKCEDYSHWAPTTGQVCGNCLALVPTRPYGGICKRYCESFGHECVFAAEESADTCEVLARYGCNEPIMDTSDMLCQCRGPLPTRQGVCSSYSSWPLLDDDPCGNCTAKIIAEPFNNTCSTYCESFGHRCVMAAEDVQDCITERVVDCNERVPDTSDIICQCEISPLAVQAPSRCAAYSQWPTIRRNVCGNCEAFVTINDPRFPAMTTCEAFCKSFGHVCNSTFRGTNCINRGSTLSCSSSITGQRLMGCQCLLP